MVRKLRAFILIILNILLCASAASYVHVHMTNSLNMGSIIYLHCVVNREEKGHQQIPYHWTCQWKFHTTMEEKTHLSCEADLQGAKQLQFVAYNESTDSCRTSCAWNFTENGAFQYMDGHWNLRYTWPH